MRETGPSESSAAAARVRENNAAPAQHTQAPNKMDDESIRRTLRMVPPRGVIRVSFREDGGEPQVWHGWVYEPKRTKKYGQRWEVTYRVRREDGHLYCIDSFLPTQEPGVEILSVESIDKLPEDLARTSPSEVPAPKPRDREPSNEQPALPAAGPESAPPSQPTLVRVRRHDPYAPLPRPPPPPEPPAHQHTNKPPPATEETFDNLVAEWSADDVLQQAFREGHRIPMLPAVAQLKGSDIVKILAAPSAKKHLRGQRRRLQPRRATRTDACSRSPQQCQQIS